MDDSEHDSGGAQRALTSFLGLSVESARQLAEKSGYDFPRVIDLDEDEWHTDDLNSNRLSLTLQDGVVVRAEMA